MDLEWHHRRRHAPWKNLWLLQNVLIKVVGDNGVILWVYFMHCPNVDNQQIWLVNNGLWLTTVAANCSVFCQNQTELGNGPHWKRQYSSSLCFLFFLKLFKVHIVKWGLRWHSIRKIKDLMDIYNAPCLSKMALLTPVSSACGTISW